MGIFQDKQAALRPNLHQEFKEVLDKEPSVDLETDEVHLHAISGMRGWKVLEEYIQELIHELDNMVNAAMTTGASWEEIGQRTMLTALTKEALKKIISKVEDAKQEISTNGDGGSDGGESVTGAGAGE
jgi:hypothetical protein